MKINEKLKVFLRPNKNTRLSDATKIENEIEAVTKTHRPCIYRQSSVKSKY